jgi:hypothetical protein
VKAERRSAPQVLKPKLWSILLLIVPVLVAQGSLHGGINGWTNVGPEGGSFWQLAEDPQDPAIIYGLTGAGLFKSKDGGASGNNAGKQPHQAEPGRDSRTTDGCGSAAGILEQSKEA